MYDGPRPLTDTAKEFRNFRRYEGEFDKVRRNYRNPAPAHQKGSSGALVNIFYQDENKDKGKIISINDKFKSFSTLLDELTGKFGKRVDLIYSWPHRQRITSLMQFSNRCVYVAAPNTRPKKGNISYGALPDTWVSTKVKDGRRGDENKLYRKDKDLKESPVRYMPLVINVSYHSARDKQETIFLNPQTSQEFEDWLDDLSKPGLPVRALYSDKPPYTQVIT